MSFSVFPWNEDALHVRNLLRRSQHVMVIIVKETCVMRISLAIQQIIHGMFLNLYLYVSVLNHMQLSD